MTTMLEQGQKVLRGEATPQPIARLLGFGLKSVEPGHAVFERNLPQKPRGIRTGILVSDKVY